MKHLIFVSLMICLCACGEVPHWKTLSANRQSVLMYQSQNFQAGLDKSIEALSYNPFYPELHINLGIGFEGLGQGEKALQSYEAAEKLARTEEQKFIARFDVAQAYGKAKKIDEAISWYQKALDVNPTSKETKTNIELLLQQQQGGGQGENKDQKDKDKQNQGGQGQDQKNQDKKDKDKKDDKDQGEDKKEPKQYQGSQKYKPREFKGELSEGDVKKILGEVRQQEQKIRADFNKKEVKERPRDKDW